MRARFADCELDGDLLDLRRGGIKVAIQPKVLALLLLLIRERHRVVARREILAELWPDVVVGEGSLAYTVLELRRAIGDEGQTMLVTVRGFGFRFAVDATVEDAPLPAPSQPASSARLTTPPAVGLLGRDVYLGALTARLEDARDGRGSFAWISGEAGIGKTRLVDELAARARTSGAAVLMGRGHEEPTPPFWVWKRLAEAMAKERCDDGALLAAARSLSTVVGQETRPERLSAFEQLTTRLLPATQPLVLILEDVQWLDVESLSLLRFFVREVRGARVVVVATHRDTTTALDARSALFAELLRAAGGLAFALRGLELEDVATLITTRLGREPTPRFVTAVHGRTGGNPLLIEQLLGTSWAEKAVDAELRTIASTTELRDELVASISRHLGAISAPCQEMLTVAALLGADLDVPTLLAACAPSSPELLDSVDEALRARLLQKSGASNLRFSHALVGEVLMKRLSGADRAARHARIGRALAVHYGEPLDRHAGKLAVHFLRAAATGTGPEAVTLARRAARHALASNDAGAAIRHLVLALQALGFVASSDALRLDVLLELAAARVAAQATDAARGTYLDAILLAQALGRADSLAAANAGLMAISPSS